MWKKLKRPLAFVLTVAMLVSLTNFEQFSVLAEGAPETTTTAAESKTSEKAEEKNTEKSEKEESASEKTTAEKKESGESSDKGETKEDSEKKSSEEAGDGDTVKKEERDTADKDKSGQDTSSENTADDETKKKDSKDSSEKKEEQKEEKTDTLSEQTLKASDTGDATVTLSGKMPKDAKVTAKSVKKDVEGKIEGQVVLAAYDITIYDADGKEYQPEDGAIRVKITTDAIKEATKADENMAVYHMKDTKSKPEKVTGKADVQSSKTVAFDAESFSVYAVTTPEEHHTLTYQFCDEDGNELSGGLYTQILSDEEELKEPDTPEKNNKVFVGWYTSSGDKFTGFGSTAKTLNGSALNESITVKLYARYKSAYYVFYMADNSNTARVLYTQKYEDKAIVNASDVPFSTNTDHALVGWSKTKNATTADNGWTINGADLTLYPVVKGAHWITYDSQGGSIVEPVYVLSEAKTVKPNDPEKAGYTFSGWYTDEPCTQAFTFGKELSENVTLYAKWTAKSVTYKIVYWQQNADDDGYSYEGSETKSGLTGNKTNVTPSLSKYEGFTLNENKTVQQTIAGDGSTVVNVYYDRNTYYVYFRNSYPYGNVIDKLTIKAKYGANISKLWPSQRYPNDYSSSWIVRKSGWSYVYQSGIQTMPLNGATFYGYQQNGTKYRTDYYVQNLDGNGYTLHHTDTWKYDGNLRTTVEDYYDIEGFSVLNEQKTKPLVSSTPDINSYAENYRDWGDRNVIGWKFYYLRNSYTITFMDGKDTLEQSTHKYEEDISGAGYTPTKEGYTFGGWYENDQLQGDPYSFNGKTMPAGNMILYAKWTPDTYTVKFELNGGEPVAEGDTQYGNQTVEKGGLVTQPADPKRDGYVFAGWKRNDTAFNFNTPIQADTTLVAQWISMNQHKITYDPNGGTGGSVTDSKEYSAGADAKILDVSSNWEAPSGKSGFICWNTKKDGTGTSYYPNDNYTMPANDVILYAIWADTRTTTLKYDYNGGTDATDKTKKSETETIEVPNEKYKITNDGTGIVRDGYEFVGWALKADETDTSKILKAGAEIQVDTLNESGNVLYAQWKEAKSKLTIRKTIVDDGLDPDDLSALESGLTFETKEDGKSDVIEKINATADGWRTGKDKSGKTTYTFTYTSADKIYKIGSKYTVTESGYDVGDKNNAKENVEYMIDAAKTGTIDSINKTETDNVVNLTNTYTRKKYTVTVKKEVTGNMGSKSQEFNFTSTGGDVTSFDLKHNESQEIKVPYETAFTVSEKDSGDGYTTTIKATPGATTQNNTYRVTVKGDVTITYTNNKNVAAATAMVTSYLPYLLAVAGAGALFTVLMAEKKRKRGKRDRY